MTGRGASGRAVLSSGARLADGCGARRALQVECPRRLGAIAAVTAGVLGPVARGYEAGQIQKRKEPTAVIRPLFPPGG